MPRADRALATKLKVYFRPRHRDRGHRMAASQILDYRGQVFINFRDYTFDDPAAHGYRWVDGKRFDLRSPAVDDMTLLSAVIRHDQFRDDYAGGGVDPQGTRHGPYQLEHITPEAFEPVDGPTSTAMLAAWADQHGEVPEQLAATLFREVFEPVRQATGRYGLKNLGRTAFHDWGGVNTDFHELILIDRTAGSLTLIVAADD
ncbi:hypothetical protein [Actinoallomurus sp. CA-150999]|uniref:hypothetical protein n=1 Tax=Actinoallomurus sp. CA-150999 TaxID=3239887 RepID=UPI003D922A80